MVPTILVAGATGNTARGVVETLPSLISKSKDISEYRILAISRSLKGATAQQLSRVQGVEWKEQNWVDITDDWLCEHEVVRVFIASHTEPTQFAEESHFLVNCLRAGVKYLVRISTTDPNVVPDTVIYYPRAHWALEMMLSQPEFRALQWTSLRPNGFFNTFSGSAVPFIQQYRQNEKQSTLRIPINEDTPTGLIDPYDVGIAAAHLLALDDVSQHNGKKYVLNGP